MNKKIIFTCIAVVVVLTIVISLFFSLKNKENQRKFKVHKTELSTIKNKINIEIIRYEKDLFELDINDLESGVQKLSEKYPEELVQEGAWSNPQMIAQLKDYLQDPVIQDIYQNTMTVFPDLTEVTNELQNAFSYYLYYFPEAKIPQIYTLVPGIDLISPSVFATENNLFINLDMYLGQNNKYYNQFGIPLYISERYDKKYIAIDCFKKALVYKYLPEQTPITVLDCMINEGKKLYFTELFFPDKSENEIIGYNTEKYKWADENQANVWKYMIEKNILFSKEEKHITNYTRETPFTKPFSNSSPGRMGAFIGWKIIKNYMERHPEVSLKELLQSTDSQKILEKSGYKPMKK